MTSLGPGRDRGRARGERSATASRRRAGSRASRACALILGGLLASILLPGTAGALIQIDRGIAGARLDNTKAEVRAALGKPAAVRRGRNEFGDWLEYRFDGGIRVFFQGRRNVTGVETRGRGDRTARGVGVGSTERAVRRRVRGVTCEQDIVRLCHTGEFLPGRRVTTFFIDRGRVTRVNVGYVID